METPNEFPVPSGSSGTASNDFPVLPPPPNSATPSNNNQAQKRLQQTQAKVDEVVGIMRVNVEKVLERDQNYRNWAKELML
ncbi:unnamed protein product [Ceratitis capitata]|uniref:(Mediterranean fruit fly) hypothetical protein n=1 Tax=Ceratitis capitata TaxID=7213 RepID=A0A811VJV6_CERCA|nr:unnamed protein product [Ceratitis capitata]